MNVTTFLIAARATAGPARLETTIVSILEGRFTVEATEGKTIVSTTEAGGTVTFAVGSRDSGFGPAEILEVAAQALIEIKTQPHWLNPNWYPRRIKRLRASFSRAVI